jgi:DNA-binding transcriptional regulator YiaG
MTGDAMRELRKSLEIPTTHLARELGVSPQTVHSAEIARKLEPKNEAKYMAAIAVIARRLAAERRRLAIEAMLGTLVDALPDLSAITV